MSVYTRNSGVLYLYLPYFPCLFSPGRELNPGRLRCRTGISCFPGVACENRRHRGGMGMSLVIWAI